jgi:hypothetical protein
MGQGRRPDVDTFMKLLAWLDRPAEEFMAHPPRSGGGSGGEIQDTIGDIGRSLRIDPALQPEDAEALEQIVRVAYLRFRGG